MDLETPENDVESEEDEISFTMQVVVGQATPGVVELLLDVMPKGESI